MFVWWQALSGAIQVALVVALASTVLPRSAYALYAWSIIIHTFIQIPGFYQVMRHALTGLQRFDYAQILDLGLGLVFPMLTQPIIVTLAMPGGAPIRSSAPRWAGCSGWGWRPTRPSFSTFLVGVWLYRRLGLGLRVLFLAHFDWQVIKNGFRFGVFEMLGSIAWAVGQAAEIWITQARLINYAEIWGNWGLAQNFIFAFKVLATLYNNLMPSISEAISHGRQRPQPVLCGAGLQVRRDDQRVHRRRPAGGGRPFHPGRVRARIRAGRDLCRPADHLGRHPVPLLGRRQRPAAPPIGPT